MIIFTSRFSYSNAVWQALLRHVDYIAKIEKVTILVDKKTFYGLESPDNAELIQYSGRVNLIKKIFSLLDKNIYFVNVLDCFLFSFLKLFNFRFFLWHQGIIPEESYSRHQSKVRYFILSFVELVSLVISDKFIFVSSQAPIYLRKKYKIIKISSYEVIPCVSELKFNNSISKKEKELSFTYIGGLSGWQCFNDMIKLYLDISAHFPEARLYIYTLDIDEAKRKVELLSKGNSVTSIFFESLNSRSEVEINLNKHRFGFLLRDDIILNNVASPIKFCEYMSCGVAPILTPALIEYAALTQSEGTGIVYNGNVHKLMVDIDGFCCEPDRIRSVYDTWFNSKDLEDKYKNLLI